MQVFQKSAFNLVKSPSSNDQKIQNMSLLSGKQQTPTNQSLPNSRKASFQSEQNLNLNNYTLMQMPFVQQQANPFDISQQLNFTAPNFCIQQQQQKMITKIFLQTLCQHKNLKSFLENLIKKKKKIENVKNYFKNTDFPQFLKLFSNILLTALKQSVSQIEESFLHELAANNKDMVVEKSVFFLIVEIINKNYFQFDNAQDNQFFQELSNVLIFRKDMTNKIIKVMEQYVDLKHRKEIFQETQQGLFLQMNQETQDILDEDCQTIKEIYDSQREIANCIHILSFQKFYQYLITSQSTAINQIFSDILFGFMEGTYSEYFSTSEETLEKNKTQQQQIKQSKRKLSMAEKKGSQYIQQRKGSLQIQTTQQKQQQQTLNQLQQKGISKLNFKSNLDSIIKTINSYFEKQNIILNFIKRQSKNKLNFQQDSILQNYIKLIGIFKQCNLMKNVDQIVQDIFQDKLILQTKEFQENLYKIHKKENNQVLFTIVELIKIELQLTELDDFFDCLQESDNMSSEVEQMTPDKANTQQQSQNASTTKNETVIQQQNQQQSPTRCNSESSPGLQNNNNQNKNQNNSTINNNNNQTKKHDNKQNYYLKTIDKLMNKCIFNGEDNCDCKKCQCIRRNRNSAKESQKRKREALQQLGPLQEKYDKLEKKVLTLNEQNKILKDLFKTILEVPDLQQEIKEVLSPKKQLLEEIEEQHISLEDDSHDKAKENMMEIQETNNNPTTNEDLHQSHDQSNDNKIENEENQKNNIQQALTMGEILSRKQSEQQQ